MREIPPTYPTRLPRRALVTGNQRLTSTGTILVSFRVVDEEPFEFEPGEYIAVDCRDPVFGYRRSPYCIFSPPNEDRTFELLVRVVQKGPVSLFLSHLEAGDVIGFRGPLGKSMLVFTGEEELVLLATGVGLGPFHSLLYTILPRGFSQPVTLYWGLRLEEDICLIESLEELAGTYPNFTYRISLSQPSPAWRGLRGRISETVPPLLQSLRNKHFYLCGNGAMIAEMTAALAHLGVPQTKIFEESFFNHKFKPEPSRVQEICSRFVATDLISPYQHLKELLGEK
ncbi:MAG: hypothetical protein D6681_21370 [Calditrichaeota bacterium]|nr:MAG: hypothetical protein D6681_21370 [Calditrichota bacterium]